MQAQELAKCASDILSRPSRSVEEVFGGKIVLPIFRHHMAQHLQIERRK
jgi:hypothetical protein